jgi:hypothetical protein
MTKFSLAFVMLILLACANTTAPEVEDDLIWKEPPLSGYNFKLGFHAIRIPAAEKPNADGPNLGSSWPLDIFGLWSHEPFGHKDWSLDGGLGKPTGDLGRTEKLPHFGEWGIIDGWYERSYDHHGEFQGQACFDIFGHAVPDCWEPGS